MANEIRPLSAAELTEFLAEEHLAVITTNAPDGFPHSTPVWYMAEPDGAMGVVAFDDTVKVRNLRRDPKAAVLIASEKPPYRWVLYRGVTEVTSEDADEYARRVSERYLGVQGAREYLDSLGAHPPFVIIRLRDPRITSMADPADS